MRRQYAVRIHSAELCNVGGDETSVQTAEVVSFEGRGKGQGSVRRQGSCYHPPDGETRDVALNVIRLL